MLRASGEFCHRATRAGTGISGLLFYLSLLILSGVVVWAVEPGGRALVLITEDLISRISFRGHEHLSRVVITGNSYLSRDAILAACDLDPTEHTPLSRVRVWRIAQRLRSLPLVNGAHVRLDETYRELFITVREKRPLARFLLNKTVFLVDENGDRIEVTAELIRGLSAGPGSLRFLPLIQGGGAHRELAAASRLQATWVERFPRASTPVVFSYVGRRRWDLVLASGVCVRLPEIKPDHAIERLYLVDRRHGILGHARTQVIDMRLPGKIFVQQGYGELEKWAVATRFGGTAQRVGN